MFAQRDEDASRGIRYEGVGRQKETSSTRGGQRGAVSRVKESLVIFLMRAAIGWEAIWEAVLKHKHS